MKTLTDQQLLRDYAESRAEEAFAEFVRRHVDHVYSTGLRIVRDAQMAEDVTQGVFMALAQNVGQLVDHPVLSGWLQRTARNLAAKAVRTEVRRRYHEEEAASMHELLSAESNANWEEIAPHLDAALSQLSPVDHDALTLRYFERKSAREMAEVLGASTEAAQKRVNRAVDRLRQALLDRGVVVGTSGLVAVLSVNVVQSAPPGLGSVITLGSALTGTALHNASAVGIMKAVAMTTLQKTIVISSVAIAVGLGIYGSRQVSLLHSQIENLRQQQETRAQQAEEWRRQREETAKRLAEAEEDNARLRREAADLARLRGEVASLRQSAREEAKTDSVAGAWAARIALLKQRLEQMPDQRIPEMQFLTEKDWAASTREADLTTSDGVRQAMRALRNVAKDNFLEAMRNAFKKYVTVANGGVAPGNPEQFAQAVNANGDLMPSALVELKPFFDSPVEDATFSRYHYLHPVKLHDNLSDILVTEIAPPVDIEYDTHHEMGLQSGGVGDVNQTADAVAAAAKRYAASNQGQLPALPAQIAPYLTQPIANSLAQKYLSRLSGDSAGLNPAGRQ